MVGVQVRENQGKPEKTRENQSQPDSGIDDNTHRGCRIHKLPAFHRPEFRDGIENGTADSEDSEGNNCWLADYWVAKMGITVARGQMVNTILQSGALKDVNFWQTDKSRTTIYLFGIVKKTIMEKKTLGSGLFYWNNY